jgi:hypothetical protein
MIQQNAVEQIFEYIRSQVPDMREVVDGWAAAVHMDGFAVGRLECFLRSGQRIMQKEWSHAAIIAPTSVRACQLPLDAVATFPVGGCAKVRLPV